jgi:Ca-activated chloride channel homolog
MPAPAPRAAMMPLMASPPSAAAFGGGGFAARARLANLDSEGGTDGMAFDEAVDDMQTLPRAMPSAPAPEPQLALEAPRKGGIGDPILEVLSRQAASGLWEEPGGDSVTLTVEALLALYRLGLTTAHAVHGAQLKKAVEALLAQLASEPVGPHLHELALGVAWLVATGRRTRQSIENTARGGGAALAALASALGDESGVRTFVDRLSPPA